MLNLTSLCALLSLFLASLENLHTKETVDPDTPRTQIQTHTVLYNVYVIHIEFVNCGLAECIQRR